MLLFRTIITVATIIALQACSDNGGGLRDNPFGEEAKTIVEASYTSNADTLFLSWKLTDKIDFDSYSITSGRNSLTLDKDADKCVLTHIPYNESVPVKVSFMKGGEEVLANFIYATIDGYDRYIASRIMPDSGSVTEGDGMYSIDLKDGRSMFLMGDSYTGVVAGGKRVSGNHMYRNTYSIYDHEKETSYALVEMNGAGTSAVVPAGVKDEGKLWYWPGHGFVVGDNLYVFQFLMYSGDGPEGWNFYFKETHIAQYQLPDVQIKPVKLQKAPFFDTPPETPSPATPLIHYGAAALNDLDATGYLYIYAQVDIENDWDPVTEVHVARTTEENLFTEWEFYNGSSWTKVQSEAKALTGLSSVPVSSQFNVVKMDGKYVLLAQNKTWNSGEIYTFTSDNPWGPWGNRKLVYKIPPLKSSNWYTYNAMIHPQLEKDGMVLVTFNVNTGTFSEQASDVESYRPKFFWIEKDMILK